MLSICIPHHNFYNPDLYKVLYHQCEQLKIPFEIIIIDDASLKEKKIYLSNFTAAQFHIIYLNENIGRSAIRNLLAKTSQFEWLLFLDADAEISDPNFIAKYLRNLDYDVIVGGRIYPENKPDENFNVHWNYGTYIESKAKHAFNSSSFLIKKSIFKTIQFDESLKEYGYEDVVFGMMLNQNGYKILNINNPVIHTDLKTNEEFIKDTKNAIANLIILKKLYPEPNLIKNISLLKHYNSLERPKATSFISIGNTFIVKYLENKLVQSYSKKSNTYLQFFKLYLYHQMLKQNP